MVKWDLYHLYDVFASQYQLSDRNPHTTNQSSICWRNLLAPGFMHEKSSQDTSLDLDSCFDHELGLISRPNATSPMREHQWVRIQYSCRNVNNLDNRVIGLRPTGVHAVVRLAKACWWDLNSVMAEPAVQVKAVSCELFSWYQEQKGSANRYYSD